MPVVSVVMSVYNGEKYLARAIDSILVQTYRDYELIIINDGSIDGTQKILADYRRRDPRIVVVEQVNFGLTRSLNRGIRMAVGKYIARQDADDVSLPERLARQVEFLENRYDVILLGTNYVEVFDGQKRSGNYKTEDQINRTVYLYNPFPHTSVMLRKEFFVAAGMYDESFRTSQDFECWMRMAQMGRLAMLEDVLVENHYHEDTISSRSRWSQGRTSMRARLKHPRLGKLRAIVAGLYKIVMSYVPKGLVYRLPGWVIRLKRRIMG